MDIHRFKQLNASRIFSFPLLLLVLDLLDKLPLVNLHDYTCTDHAQLTTVQLSSTHHVFVIQRQLNLLLLALFGA